MKTTSSTTLTDVAARAGVSIGTASKALNDRGSMRAATRQRVVDAARHLNYAPNLQARSLHDGRTGTVGLITNDLSGRFSLPILRGAEDALGSGNLSVLLCDSRGDTIRERHQVQSLIARRVEGLIMVGEPADPRPSLGPNVPIPVVYAYSPSHNLSDTSVTTDDRTSGRLAVEHLLSLGRRRIVHIGGDLRQRAAAERAHGGAEMLRSSLGETYVIPPVFGAWTEEWGRTATKSLLGQQITFDAIMCGSDQIARGVLDVLRFANVRVPDDIAVIGHDNWEVFALHSLPPLTTIDMDLERVGSRAVQLISELSLGRSVPGVEYVPARIVTRHTTG